jgi:hypothetical protein
VYRVGIRAPHAEFTTVHSPGGRRLAISADGRRAFAAGYERGGIAAYDAGAGALLWHRADLRQAQSVRLTLDDDLLLCGFERGPARVVSASSGEPRETLRRVKHIIPLDADVWLLVFQRRYHLRRAGQRDTPIEATSFGLLDALLADGVLWLSEAAAGVRSFAASDGTLMSAYSPPRGSHVLNLARADDGACYGIEWPYQRGGTHRAVRFEDGNARITAELQLSWPFVLVPSRSMAVLASADVVPVVTA